ncbi:MAG: DUF1287 domain-containing protein [Blastocatellia bacterium]
MRAPLLICLTVLALLTAGCGYGGYITSGLQQIMREQSVSEDKVSRGEASAIERLIAAAVEQVRYTTVYDPTPVRLKYPGGDVARDRGMAGDVIIRAFRAVNIDLQKEIYEDARRNPTLYVHQTPGGQPDPSYDHRVTANLLTWFQRQGKAVRMTQDPLDYNPGDLVFWDLGNNRVHGGIVSDVRSAEDETRYLVVHNLNAGAELQDVLFTARIIGHYRWFSGGGAIRTDPAAPSSIPVDPPIAYSTPAPTPIPYATATPYPYATATPSAYDPWDRVTPAATPGRRPAMPVNDDEIRILQPDGTRKTGTVRATTPLSATRQPAPSGALKIGYIETRRSGAGCGCAFQFPEDYLDNRPRYIFVNNNDGFAMMNIDGQDMQLEFVNRKDPPTDRIIQEGDASIEMYLAGRASVRIDYAVTRMCRPGDVGCERTWYDATITVVRDGLRRSVKAKGVCGC